MSRDLFIKVRLSSTRCILRIANLASANYSGLLVLEQGGGSGWRILTLSSISPSPSHQCQSLHWKASHCAHCYMILTVHCTNGRVQTTSGRSQAEQCTEFSGIANLHQSNRQCLGPTADPRLPKRQISFWTCNCLCFWDSHRKHSHRYITIVFVMCH